jgi:signal transduction histidine kinase
MAFAVLLIISGTAGWATWRNMSEAQASTAALFQRDLEIHQALGEVRTGVYQAAILVRDYFLDAPTDHPEYRDQFAALKVRLHSSVEALRQTLGSDEARVTLARLASELDDYDTATDEVLNWTPEQRVRLQAETLRRRGTRRRDILSLAERLETLAAQSSEQQRKLLEETDGSFRSSLSGIAVMTFLLGAAVAGLTLIRMRLLERESEEAQSELRSLSGQLRTAQEQERKFLSRELHDQVGQMLTGLRMELTAVSRNRANVDPEMLLSLDRAKATVEQTLGIVRNIAMLLRPSMLDDLGLTPALTWLVKEIARSSGIDIRREIDERVDQLPDAHRTCLYRVVQEALTNASRHSGARNVSLTVTAGDAWVHATVQDDGRGFEVTAHKTRGLGLVGMEERVKELGGHL